MEKVIEKLESMLMESGLEPLDAHLSKWHMCPDDAGNQEDVKVISFQTQKTGMAWQGESNRNLASGDDEYNWT